MKKVAVYTGSRNLYPLMVPAVKSLLKWSSVDEVWLFIEDDEFPERLPECVKTRNVSNQQYFPEGSANMRSFFTYFALMRAALCHEFPDLDIILSLDVDTICVGPVDELWDTPMDGFYFSAAIEPHRSIGGLEYCNTGVSLYNLKLLRESGKADEVIRVLNKHSFNWVEQDVFSYLCQGGIRQMSASFNSCPWVLPHDCTRIVHYAGKREWARENDYRIAEALTWEEVLGDRK